MPKLSRRSLLTSAAAGFIAGVGLGKAQSVPQRTPSPSSPKRQFSMSLGVHMTNWQYLLEKRVVTWEDIGRISAELGFTGIQLQANNVAGLDKSALKNIKDTLTSHGLKILAINIDNNFLHPDFDGQIKMVRDFAELCAYFEAPFERIYLGRKVTQMSDPQAFDTIRKGLETCLPFWEKLNVVAAPEPPDVFRVTPSGVQTVPKQYPAGDISAIVTLLKVVDSKYFRYMLDTGCIPPDEKYIWPKLTAPYVVGMHIKEWQFNWRTNDPIDTDYVRFLEPFKESGFHGSLDLEIRDPVHGGFFLGDTVVEVTAKLVKLRDYLKNCIAA